MSWITSLKCDDGLEEFKPGRIVSFTDGDDTIQMMGFFTLQEVEALAAELRERMPHLPSVQRLQHLLQLGRSE